MRRMNVAQRKHDDYLNPGEVCVVHALHLFLLFLARLAVLP